MSIWMKKYRKWKTDDNWNYLKIVADNLLIACDEIISVMDIVSTKMTNTTAKSCHS